MTEIPKGQGQTNREGRVAMVLALSADVYGTDSWTGIPYCVLVSAVAGA